MKNHINNTLPKEKIQGDRSVVFLQLHEDIDLLVTSCVLCLYHKNCKFRILYLFVLIDSLSRLMLRPTFSRLSKTVCSEFLKRYSQSPTSSFGTIIPENVSEEENNSDDGENEENNIEESVGESESSDEEVLVHQRRISCL